MAYEERTVPRLRATPLLIAAVAVQLAGVGLYLTNLTEQRLPPFVCWLPSIISTLLAAYACRRTAAAPASPRCRAALWRQLGVVVILVAVGLAGDARRAFLEPTGFDGEQHDPPTAACYGLAMAMLLWALLRLPIGRANDRQRVMRFVLDALTIGVTMGIFAWYFAARARPTAGPAVARTSYR